MILTKKHNPVSTLTDSSMAPPGESGVAGWHSRHMDSESDSWVGDEHCRWDKDSDRRSPCCGWDWDGSRESMTTSSTCRDSESESWDGDIGISFIWVDGVVPSAEEAEVGVCWCSGFKRSSPPLSTSGGWGGVALHSSHTMLTGFPQRRQRRWAETLLLAVSYL